MEIDKIEPRFLIGQFQIKKLEIAKWPLRYFYNFWKLWFDPLNFKLYYI